MIFSFYLEAITYGIFVLFGFLLSIAGFFVSFARAPPLLGTVLKCPSCPHCLRF